MIMCKELLHLKNHNNTFHYGGLVGKPQIWPNAGEHRKIAGKYGKSLIEQDFENPHTGQIETFSLLVQKDWSVVLALTCGNQVLVVNEFKQGRNSIERELSAGTADFNESPSEVMKRELLQETGYQAGELISLGFGWMATRNSPTKAHLFLATGCQKTQPAKLDTSEVIETELIPLNDWIQLVVDGQINEWSAVMATVRALPHLGLRIS
ncbi:MAG: NUDIX hydrolase [Patescibacteria group bacterium]